MQEEIANKGFLGTYYILSTYTQNPQTYILIFNANIIKLFSIFDMKAFKA